MNNNRAGSFIKQPFGYYTFRPNPLPPSPPVKIDSQMISLLSKADRMLGRLDGVTQTLPNPELFVAMYVQKEAVLSSQIEGTQASLSDLLDISSSDEKRHSIAEVVNYVNAMEYGLKRIRALPLSLRLIKEIHAVLLNKGRGSSKTPGEFRSSQNWIGPAGCSLIDATFVPPTVPDMKEALGDIENFFYSEDEIPPLIKIALIHAQFESIHPFLDGNGRMGRLLITFWLCQQNILSQPLLYLSYYFKKHRTGYFDSLMKVRQDGEWEQWINYFLIGVAETSEEAINTAKDILQLKADCEAKLQRKGGINYTKLLELLFVTPTVYKSTVSERLGVSTPTASKIVDDFVNLKIIVDVTPNKQRYKKYAFMKYIIILNRGTELTQ